MNNIDQRNPEFFDNQTTGGNSLLYYIKTMSPETISQLSRPGSSEVSEAIERTIVAMLGGLPSDDFNVMISTNRENLGKLLASAMLNGYLLRNAEQRMAFENSLQSLEASSPDND
ncbi:DUF760 domain-containing protein [Calothrix sp. CCY 0018]|uniref:DUF760 domain-containing protein n=1 Tax=Calothrix sp. CCY 0018 TaxID=3103864 RepID=UPI0039C617E6